MDALLTFESSYETYQSSFVPNDWTPKDPRKIWHIIYRVPEAQIASVAAMARDRYAGLLQITDDDNPNPYDNLPSDSYMRSVMASVAGGVPLVQKPADLPGSYVAGLPGDTSVTFSDYSSVKLQWSAVANASGYAVYKNDVLVLELPPSLTRATVGGIHSSTKNIRFEVRARLDSGGGSPRVVTASTLDLPANQVLRHPRTRTNADGTVTYTIDVLIPFAFVRLFLTDDWLFRTRYNGWPMLYKKEYLGIKYD